MAMSDWGTEEDLIDFARDGEGHLDLRVPSGDDSVWEDVIGNAKEAQAA
jgi:amidase